MRLVRLQMVTTLAKLYRFLVQELRLQMRQQVKQYISNNRNNHDLRINEGINIEPLFGAGMKPFTYNLHDDYIAKMSSPYTYMGQPEITAISALYGKTVHVHYNDSALPPPAFATLDGIHLRYTQVCRHYDTHQLIIPRPDSQSHPTHSGGGLPSASS